MNIELDKYYLVLETPCGLIVYERPFDTVRQAVHFRNVHDLLNPFEPLRGSGVENNILPIRDIWTEEDE